jgi:hypothetical protein
MGSVNLDKLWWQLLHHKCLYYVYPDSGTVLSDNDYDRLESFWEKKTGKEMVVGFPTTLAEAGCVGATIIRIGPQAIKEYLTSDEGIRPEDLGV